MKIAILIPGHIRAWDFCKENFMKNVYDTEHHIDVFIETYFQIFRTDYHLHKENEMQITKNEKEIRHMFDGLNVVHFGVEEQRSGPAATMQKEKLLKCYMNFSEFVKNNGAYDLVVRTRFDILFDEKINYNSILEQNIKNPKLIFIATGVINMRHNDMFCVCIPETFDLYANRFNNNDDPHITMEQIERQHGIKYDNNTRISIVRLDGNKNYRIEK